MVLIVHSLIVLLWYYWRVSWIIVSSYLAHVIRNINMRFDIWEIQAVDTIHINSYEKAHSGCRRRNPYFKLCARDPLV